MTGKLSMVTQIENEDVMSNIEFWKYVIENSKKYESESFYEKIYF